MRIAKQVGLGFLSFVASRRLILEDDVQGVDDTATIVSSPFMILLVWLETIRRTYPGR